jgi:hypothetical protein
MKAHRLDATSLVLGLLVAALGVTAWAGRLGELINHPAAAIPLIAALVGITLIASARRPARPVEPSPPAPVSPAPDAP